MRYQGKIIKWHDNKGYGFVRATSDSKNVFLHISDIHRLNKRPEINELVSYELMKDARGRFRATHVVYQTQSATIRNTEQPTKLNSTFLVFILMFFTLVTERTLKGFLPVTFTLILFGVNLILFLYYYQDKTSAMKKTSRTPESTLHWLSLIGGWPSAYVAQKLFNHKHKKQSFLVTYRLTVLINCSAVMLYSLPYLQNMLISLLTK